MTVVNSLIKLAGCYNVQPEAFTQNDTTDECIDKIAGGIKFGASNVAVSTPTPVTKKYWGTAVQDMQTSISIDGTAITGTLHKLTEGQLVTDWG